MDKNPPKIRVDPHNRCLTMLFYNDILAVLPFRQGGVDDGENLESLLNASADDPTGGGGIPNDRGKENQDNNHTSQPYMPSFVLKASSIDKSIRNVVDVAFLAEYSEPALAILYETNQTWTG